MPRPDRPNIVFVFADQWRAQATGYANDPNVRTPQLDALAEESVSFRRMVAGCPVCSPYRASLLTGQYPLTHGVFVNDVCLSRSAPSFADVLNAAGYTTGYIGKWHLDGHGRSAFIPPERRQGFRYWRVLECTHKYFDSWYYGDGPEKRKWPGYDAEAQSREAQGFLRAQAGRGPFALFLSWGPPHSPFYPAPEAYLRWYTEADLVLRPNVPAELAGEVRHNLAGYYAHISALDAGVGELLRTLDETGQAENTIFVFTADHGEMIGSHGYYNKQSPWDESILAPLLVRYPAVLGRRARTIETPVNAPDLMPTLLGLAGLAAPDTVEGDDLSAVLRGERELADNPVLLACYHAFSQWFAAGGRDYRGVRTRRYTYVRDLGGPWLLYDNDADPYQMTNLCGREEARTLEASLDCILQSLLRRTGDGFLPGTDYMKRWGYPMDQYMAVPYTD